MFEQDNDATTHGIPEDIRLLAEQRRQAKQEKNWQLADELRDKLHELGRIMKDGKDGYDVTKE